MEKSSVYGSNVLMQKMRRCIQRCKSSSLSDSILFLQFGSRKRRIKLVVDREYENSSTGEDSVPETQRGRGPPSLSSHANINGGIYVAQNGSIIRTRRSVTTSGPLNTHTNANNNLKIPSPVFSSRLAKHFKKLDKLATTLEERVPLHSPTAEAGCKIPHTFQGSGPADPGTAANRNKTLTGIITQQSNMSATSTSHSNSSGSESAAAKSDLLKAPQVSTEQPWSTSERGGEERESKVDGSTSDDDQGLVLRGSLGCPSDRTQSDEDELWMGPWNNLHIPMTKL